MSTTYDFSVILSGVSHMTTDDVERLYPCCPDGTQSESDGVVRIGFSRKASSFAEAVGTGLRDIRSCGLRAARIEGEELVSAAVVAERMGRSRESVRLLIEGKRGPGGFPRPAETVGRRFRLWRWPEVERWFAAYERREPRVEDQTAVIAAINLILTLRQEEDRLQPAVRRALARMARDERSLLSVR